MIFLPDVNCDKIVALFFLLIVLVLNFTCDSIVGAIIKGNHLMIDLEALDSVVRMRQATLIYFHYISFTLSFSRLMFFNCY